MPELLYDPPELTQVASRGDPPMSEWPGEIVRREHLMQASGDPRDWFRYRHRERAAGEAWYEFVDSRRRRKSLFKGFDWNQILIIGEFGAGKTTLGVLIARYYFGLGHAVFSNTSCLFGWRMGLEELYTAMGRIPKNSVLLVDETSAALSGSMGAGVAVQMWGEFGLNIRKQNGLVIYMTAKDHMVAHSVRRECKEVWMPIKRGDMTIEKPYGTNGGVDLLPADDPDNFMMGVHIWDDYPYQKRNLIEGKDPNENGGFGSPVRTRFYSGSRVRDAYLMNDTFELAQAGAARLSDREAIKNSARAQLQGRAHSSVQGPSDNQYTQRLGLLLQFIDSHKDDPPEYWRASEIGVAIGMDASSAAKFLMQVTTDPDTGVTPVKSVQRKGYPTAPLYEWYSQFE